ncbi:MAG: prolipoprotein diacylglyceryl transferase [Acidimicrobiales bacterium]
MKPVPVAFHVGPLEVHTYGIGLAITFWFAYAYFRRRLRHHGYPTDWLVGVFIWVIVAAVVGARAMSVLSNLGYYGQHPGDIVAVWHGGLSSFGGLILAVPTALVLTRRRCPELSMARGLDLVAPVLAAAWAMGRLLGPQLMVAGGGHPTTQWFGMYYATQAGKRLPVPIFQAVEDFTIFVVLILLERRLDRWPDGSARVGYPAGAVVGTGMVLWGIERAADQRLWLAYPNNLGSALVQVAGVALAVGGVAVLAVTRRHWRAWQAAGAPGGRPETTGPVHDGSAGDTDAAGGASGPGNGMDPASAPGTGAVGDEELSGVDP